MNIKERFGLAIKELRSLKKVSQETLALECGIDRTYIGDIEKGNRNVSLEMIEKLAHYFGISMSEMFGKIEGMEVGKNKIK